MFESAPRKRQRHGAPRAAYRRFSGCASSCLPHIATNHQEYGIGNSDSDSDDGGSAAAAAAGAWKRRGKKEKGLFDGVKWSHVAVMFMMVSVGAMPFLMMVRVWRGRVCTC